MFIELHARSAFSFLEGSSIPEEMVESCAERGMGAMAMLDRDGVYGAPRFYHAAKKKGIRAHIGAEITTPEGWRFPVLVESREGYQNLCRAITLMKLRAKKGEGSLAGSELGAYTHGMVCLTGGEEGPMAYALANGGMERAKQAVEMLCEIFGRGSVYVELQRHYCREEEARNQAAIEIARKLSLPLLATNCASYAQPQQRELLDVFTCIRHHRNLANAGRLLARNAERYLKSLRRDDEAFRGLAGDDCEYGILSSRLEFSLKDLGYQFPKYPVPEGETQMSFLRERTHEGRFGATARTTTKARKQIDRELAMIEKLELPGYFLIVWDIVRFCRAQNILVQGRGSAANSAVCYSLGITAVDPVAMDLLFERFLSEERGEWPDIDLDLPSGDQRERAIQYVYERYGKLGAAMTANVITYRGRSAAREMGKALSFEPETLDRLASLVSRVGIARITPTRMESHFRDAGFDRPSIRRSANFLSCACMVQDLPRHLGQHSGGMVVCQGQLDSVVPLEPASMPGRVVVQWDKEDCADMGIVKVDLLGLGMMAVLEDSIKIIRDDYREEVDLAHLPANDPQVYGALAASRYGGDVSDREPGADGVPAAAASRNVLRYCGAGGDHPARADCGEDGASVSEAAAGPGSCRVACIPRLKPVLERTLGVPLFQEQLLRMAMIAAGFHAAVRRRNCGAPSDSSAPNSA